MGSTPTVVTEKLGLPARLLASIEAAPVRSPRLHEKLMVPRSRSSNPSLFKKIRSKMCRLPRRIRSKIFSPAVDA